MGRNRGCWVILVTLGGIDSSVQQPGAGGIEMFAADDQRREPFGSDGRAGWSPRSFKAPHDEMPAGSATIFPQWGDAFEPCDFPKITGRCGGGEVFRWGAPKVVSMRTLIALIRAAIALEPSRQRVHSRQGLSRIRSA